VGINRTCDWTMYVIVKNQTKSIEIR